MQSQMIIQLATPRRRAIIDLKKQLNASWFEGRLQVNELGIIEGHVLGMPLQDENVPVFVFEDLVGNVRSVYVDCVQFVKEETDESSDSN